MNYGGQRVDIAVVFGRERVAAALRDRLDQMNAIMDAAQAYGRDAVEEAPESRYGTRPEIE